MGHCLTTTSTFGIIHLQCLQIYFVSWRNTVVRVLQYYWCVGGIALLSDSSSAAAPPPRSPPPPPPPPCISVTLPCQTQLKNAANVLSGKISTLKDSFTQASLVTCCHFCTRGVKILMKKEKIWRPKNVSTPHFLCLGVSNANLASASLQREQFALCRVASIN